MCHWLLRARAACSLCLQIGLYSDTESKGSAHIIVCKGLCLTPRWLECFFLLCVCVCTHTHKYMPKLITCLSVKAVGSVLAWGVCGWPLPQHPLQSLSQQEQLLPWGPPSLFQAAAAFPQINPSAPASHFPARGPWAGWGGVSRGQCPQQAS